MKQIVLTFLARLGILLAAYEVSLWIRQSFLSSYLSGESLFDFYSQFFLIASLIIGFFAYLDGWFSPAWLRQSRSSRVLRNMRIFFYSLVGLSIAAFFLQFHLFSRTFLLLFIFIALFGEILFDLWIGEFQGRVRTVLCFGDKVLSKALSRWTRENGAGLVFLESGEGETEFQQAKQALLKFEPDEIFFLGSVNSPELLLKEVQDCIAEHGLRTQLRDLSVLSKVFPEARGFARYDRYLRELLAEPSPLDWGIRWKRCFDLLMVLSLSPLLLLFFSIIFITLKIFNGEALFSQDRIGQLGKVFRIYKFRTLECGQETGKPSASRDTRLAPLGWFLRRTSLDELPQFLNVIRGEMSLVGPRPELVPIVQQEYGSFHWKRVLLKPGLTGLWQIHGRRQPIHDHLKYDFFYLHHQSFWLDLIILARTFPAVVFGRGAR